MDTDKTRCIPSKRLRAWHRKARKAGSTNLSLKAYAAVRDRALNKTWRANKRR